MIIENQADKIKQDLVDTYSEVIDKDIWYHYALEIATATSNNDVATLLNIQEELRQYGLYI